MNCAAKKNPQQKVYKGSFLNYLCKNKQQKLNLYYDMPRKVAFSGKQKRVQLYERNLRKAEKGKQEKKKKFI